MYNMKMLIMCGYNENIMVQYENIIDKCNQ
jgi:hypothetical protein